MASTPIFSYDLVGVKEDVSDIITNISPSSTPFQTMIGSEKVTQKLYQWQEDSLLPIQANAQLEGADATAGTWQPTVMRSNTTQIFSKVAKVSGTTEATKEHGRANELAYQLNMRSKEAKRDFEYALVGNGQGEVVGSDTAARNFAGYQAMISPTLIYTAGTGGGLNFTGATPSRSIITEAAVLAVAEAGYSAGADFDTLMICPGDALNVAAFATNGRTKFVENTEKKLVNVVDVYESPYGQLKVVMNRWLRGSDALISMGLNAGTKDALLFESGRWKKAMLRNWFRQTLAKTGDSTNVQILGEFGLMHTNFGASGLITNLL